VEAHETHPMKTCSGTYREAATTGTLTPKARTTRNRDETHLFRRTGAASNAAKRKRKLRERPGKKTSSQIVKEPPIRLHSRPLIQDYYSTLGDSTLL